MLITETKLKYSTSVHLNNCIPPKYKYFHVPRPDSDRAGGVGIITRLEFLPTIKTITNIVIKSFEYIAVQINIQGRKLLLINIYRPPLKSTKNFLRDFPLFLQHVNTFEMKCIITGDFNIRVNDTKRKTTEQYLQLLNDFSLQNSVNVPTFGSGNTLDLVLDNYVDPIVQNINVSKEYTFSDHYLVKFDINIIFVPNKIKKEIKFRVYSEANKTAFFEFLEVELKRSLTHIDDPTEFMTVLNHILENAEEQFFPLQTKIITERSDADWYDKECRLAKTECRKVERLVQKFLRLQKITGNFNENDIKELKAAWRNVIKNFNQLISFKKKAYYTEKFQAYLINPRATYGLVAHLLGKKGDKILPTWSKTDPCKFVNEFNLYLQNKVANIRKEIISVSPDIFAQLRTHTVNGPNMTSFAPINENDMLKFITKCKLTHSPNDKIDFTKLKLDFLKDTMLKQINNCFLFGKFPETEKEGIITPILKNGALDSEFFACYRSITNIPAPPKLAEFAMHDLDSRELIPELHPNFGVS